VKISASIYSDKKRPLKEVIADLEAHHVDLLHVDCNDDASVFEDIKQIRTWTNIPIDLHIITPTPSKYYPFLLETPVDYITFQVEDLQEKLDIPAAITGKKGLAIITPTSTDVFDVYADFDFILIMATIPGQSGGVFDRVNFKKIRDFKRKYPSKSVHVDGGVNAEVSFILRNMGVTSSVSGSYLFNAASVGHALMNLTSRVIDSHYHVGDFMIPFEECPSIKESEMSFFNVLTSIEKGQLGFTLVVDEEQTFKGIISNADVRKGLIKHYDQLNNFDSVNLVNTNALTINDSNTVLELLQVIKKASFPVTYIPVVNGANQAVGIITFVNLIKGEL
jgi:ribulose-phosphate 3-epimerase